MMSKLRTATINDLPGINRVIEAAVMSWDLPERVKRLSLSTYYYNELDLQHIEIIVAEEERKIIALVSWEIAEDKYTPGHQRGLLIHGLYVHPDVQKRGLGTQLLRAVENIAKEKSLDGLLVKAQKDAVGFFRKSGMQPVTVINSDKDYQNRFWKSLHTSPLPQEQG